MDTQILKYIIKTTLLILVVSFIGDKIIFYALNKISDRVYTGQSIGKLNQYLTLKDSLDLIVYGSSRANHNIDPTELSNNAYNTGVDGIKLAYSATLIKLLASQSQQTILLHIDADYSFDADYSGQDIRSLKSKYNRNSIIKQEIDELNQDNMLQNYFWSLSYNNSIIGILKNYVRPNYDYKTYFGYDPIHVTENQKKILEKIIEKDSDSESPTCDSTHVMNEVYSNSLDELKEFCAKNNKKLILFTSPIFDDKCKDDNNALKQILEQKGFTYYDYTDFFKDNNSLDFWKDRTHLSDKGAEFFTQELKTLFVK